MRNEEWTRKPIPRSSLLCQHLDQFDRFSRISPRVPRAPPWFFDFYGGSPLAEARFLAMLAELRKRYEFRAVTTEGLRALVQEFRPRGVTAESIDTFFDNWVYATGVPGLKLEYKVTGAPPSVSLSGALAQSGVDEDFSIDVPVEVQFAKGPSQTIWIRSSTGEETFSEKLRQTPVRVVVPDDVFKR